MGRHWLLGRQAAERGLDVRAHLLDAVTAERGAQHRDGRRDRDVIRPGLERGSALGGGEPALGRPGAAAECVNPASEYCDGRVLLELRLVVESLEPALDLGDPAPVVGRQRDRGHDPRHAVDVAGSFGVAERRLRVAVGLEPVRRAAVERHDQRRLGLTELARQQIAQQRMAAVRLAVPVEGGEQQVSALERREDAARVLLLQDGVADRGGQTLEHRCSPEKGPQLVRQRGEELGAEVLRQEPIVASRQGLVAPAGVLAGREHAETDTRRPALAAPDQLGGLVARETRAQAAQQRLALPPAQRQVGRAQLEQASIRAKPSDRQRRGEASHQSQRRSGRDVLGQRRQHLRRVARPDQLRVVEHDHEVLERAQPGREPLQLGRPLLREASGRDTGPVVGRDALERLAEPGEEDGRVVVGLVDGEPCAGPSLALDPLRRERRLAVSRGGDERDEGRRCRPQAVHERGPRHRPGRRGGHANLCFDDVRRLGSRSAGARARHARKYGRFVAPVPERAHHSFRVGRHQCRRGVLHRRRDNERLVAIRVILAEDSYLAREGIVRVLESIEDLDLVAAYGDLDTARAGVESARPDVVVTDIRMPPGHTDEGIRLADELRTTQPAVGVVVLSQHMDPRYALALFDRGAAGRAYLLKERVGTGRARSRRSRGGERRVRRRSADRRGAPVRAQAERPHAPRGVDAARARDPRADRGRPQQRRDRGDAGRSRSGRSSGTSTRSSASSSWTSPRTSAGGSRRRCSTSPVPAREQRRRAAGSSTRGGRSAAWRER